VASLQQLLYFFPYDLTLLSVELLPSLVDRSDVGVHSEAMTQEIRVNTGHVGGRPCEGVEVSGYDPDDLIL